MGVFRMKKSVRTPKNRLKRRARPNEVGAARLIFRLFHLAPGARLHSIYARTSTRVTRRARHTHVYIKGSFFAVALDKPGAPCYNRFPGMGL